MSFNKTVCEIGGAVALKIDESTYTKELLQIGISQEHVDAIVDNYTKSKDTLSDYLRDESL